MPQKYNNKNFKSKPQEKQGLRVAVREGDFNGAMRKFKKKVIEDGKLQEVRERQEYVKPSEKRRRAKSAGRARHLKNLEKQQLPSKDY